MSLVAYIYCEYRYEGGDSWWPVATFEIGSARRFRDAVTKVELGSRGLPEDLSESVLDVYERLKESFRLYPEEGPFDETWLGTDELSQLLPAANWLSDDELDRFPASAHDGYGESDTLQAWQAFAQAHEANGHPVRFVVWFTW
ncbi:hypothetical protein [Deinococcus budaensis]|uniref:DUF1877 family protein n=1 Tax=Deinococcus budaensis TaxID=1665626 RepID=A0A7W8GFY2_9DEIO|nr:hypothetical protein [Deinococcus budaensis]MBB5234850.1 hypothetical protein [Deinococcus budaensis]